MINNEPIYTKPTLRDFRGLLETLPRIGPNRSDAFLYAIGAYLPNVTDGLGVALNYLGDCFDPYGFGLKKLEELQDWREPQLTIAARTIAENTFNQNFKLGYLDLLKGKIGINVKNYFKIFRGIPEMKLNLGKGIIWHDSYSINTTPIIAEWCNPNPNICPNCPLFQTAIKGSLDSEKVVCSQQRHKKSDLRMRQLGAIPQEAVMVRFSPDNEFDDKSLNRVFSAFMRLATCFHGSNFKTAKDDFIVNNIPVRERIRNRFGV